MSGEALSQMRLSVHPGRSVVARIGELALFAIPTESSKQSMMALVNATSAGAGPAISSAAAVRQIQRLVLDMDSSSTPAFALVACVEEGCLLLTRGAVEVRYHTPAGEVIFTGAEAATWVDRLLPSVPQNLHVVPTGSERPAGEPWSDLIAGVVAGDGFSLERAGIRTHETPAPAPQPPPPPPPPLPEPSTPLIEIIDLSKPPAPPSPKPQPVADIDQVEGIICSRGHFNDPRSVYCSHCGVAMTQATHTLVKAKRPPLGYLVFDDGATFSVNTDYVIGRTPDNHPRVIAGEARPLYLADPTRTLSRVHMEIVLAGWDVLAIDRSTTNASFYARAAEQRWNPMNRDSPVVVTPGTRFMLGDREFTFESHHRY